jgi:hypothetical protein
VDGREAARAWIEEHVPPGSRIGVEAYGPWVDPARYTVRGAFRLSSQPPAWYVEQGYDYLVIGQKGFGRFYLEARRYASQVREYDALFAAFPLVKSWREGEYEVRLYRVTPVPAPVAERVPLDQGSSAPPG